MIAALSLAALLVAIVLSCFAPVHVGVLCLAFAFLIGHLLGGMKLAAILAGFPVSLFLTLFGVMFLFAQAGANGTLEAVARRSVRLARGNRGVIPLVFFVLAVVLGAIGPGGIAAAALLAPVAMSVAAESGTGAFLMTLMVANGANAGTLSPIAPTGIIAVELMTRMGLPDPGWSNFWNSLLAQSAVALGGYGIAGGWRMLREPPLDLAETRIEAFTSAQKMTLAVIAAVCIAVVGFRLDVGVAALIAASVLSLLRCAEDDAALKAVPWSVLMLVSGVTVLIGVMDKTGGMDLFTSLLARIANPLWLPGMLALVCGIVSVYSSSSGVVLPAFLPTIPGIIARLGGGDPLMAAYSVNVGAHLVDVSPLSTIGALCIAAVPATEDRDALFRKLLLWGWSMALVGAVVCQVLFGFLR
ncbi:MAG: C4-dicarboxylate ABC transporter [Acidobacteria bacterium]|nr:C4-dicarboxylate ABC transporter [Acidobacteriota bacterium]